MFTIILRTEYSLRKLRGGEDSHLLQAVVPIPHSSGLVYVYHNNIYFRPTAANPTVEYELTNNGIPGLIYNGVTDLIYCGNYLFFIILIPPV